MPRTARRPPPDRARRLAFDALRTVNADGGYANLVLSDLLGRRRLSPQDAGFATELVAGTCRWQGSYDVVLAAASGRPVGSLQPAVLDLLRLGAHQILGMRVPAHAAVASSVDLAVATVGPRVGGLVNAVLRRLAGADLDTWLERASAGLDERDRLALRTAHPRWVVDAYAEVLPPDELGAALVADNVNPEVTLAVRPGLAEVAELVAAGARPGAHSPYAAVWKGNPADLPAVREGRAGVQDEGSQLVAWGLARGDAPAGPWLDVCAGPGGKAALLAGLAATGGGSGGDAGGGTGAPGAGAPGVGLLAADLSPHRAALVASALRGYRRGVQVLVADGTRPPWRDGAFARVLADVPCTGLGALRRRPEARWRRRPADVEALHPVQCRLLAAALDAAAPGGLVGYVTCSPHRRETRDVVVETLAARDGVTVVDAARVLPGLADAAAGPYLQLWPHRHGTDAMFAAYLRTPG